MIDLECKQTVSINTTHTHTRKLHATHAPRYRLSTRPWTRFPPHRHRLFLLLRVSPPRTRGKSLIASMPSSLWQLWHKCTRAKGTKKPEGARISAFGFSLGPFPSHNSKFHPPFIRPSVVHPSIHPSIHPSARLTTSPDPPPLAPHTAHRISYIVPPPPPPPPQPTTQTQTQTRNTQHAHTHTPRGKLTGQKASFVLSGVSETNRAISRTCYVRVRLHHPWPLPMGHPSSSIIIPFRPYGLSIHPRYDTILSHPIRISVIQPANPASHPAPCVFLLKLSYAQSPIPLTRSIFIVINHQSSSSSSSSSSITTYTHTYIHTYIYICIHIFSGMFRRERKK
jgi:hypothetical protein